MPFYKSYGIIISMKHTIILSLFFLQSCAFKLGKEIKQLKIKGDSFNQVIAKKNPIITKKFESKSCTKIYSIIPTKLKADFSEIINNACGEKEYIVNAQFWDTFYYIPMIYGEECYVLKGSCAKN